MHTINDLRKHLFETLEALRDKKNPMDTERANAIAHTAQVIVNSARVELHYLELLGGEGTGFVPEVDHERLPNGKGETLRLVNK